MNYYGLLIKNIILAILGIFHNSCQPNVKQSPCVVMLCFVLFCQFFDRWMHDFNLVNE